MTRRMSNPFAACLALAVGLPAVSLPGLAQTTTTTTPAVKLVPKPAVKPSAALTPAQLAAKREEERKLEERRREELAKKNGTTGGTLTPAQAAAVRHDEHESRPWGAPAAAGTQAGAERRPWGAPAAAGTQPANAAARPAWGAPATAAAPANTLVSQPAAAPAARQAWGLPAAAAASPTATAAAPGVGTNAVTGGYGRFTDGHYNLVSYGCLRAGTRAFCDFDVMSDQTLQLNSNNGFRNAKLAMNGGRVVNSASTTFVDQDGTVFQQASVSPNTPVRYLIEYDDIPETQTVVTLTYGNNNIQNLPIGDMPPAQANGGVPARLAATQAAAPAAGAPKQSFADRATNAQATATGAAGAASTAGSTMTNVKAGLGGLLKGKSTPQQ